MKETINYKLRKPDQEDFYNVEDFNYNADIIDSLLKTNADTITQHINDPAPHSGHAAKAHTHSGSDITSAVANATNADTVDGKHATDFAAASHTHTKSQITDFAHTHTGADITSAVANATNADTVDGKHASDFAGIISNNITLTIPTDYPTVQAALDYLRDKFIPSNVTVTIRINAGVYNFSAPLLVSHPCGRQIKIIGEDCPSTGITGFSSATNVGGLGYFTFFDVRLKLASSGFLQANDWVIIRDLSGTNCDLLYGVFKVISVDTVNNIVTIRAYNRTSTWPIMSITSGTLIKIPTVFKFAVSDPNSSEFGLIVNGELGYLDNVVLVGSRGETLSSTGHGLTIRNDTMARNGFIHCGVNVAITSFKGNGIMAENGGVIVASKCVTSYNGWSGIAAERQGYVFAENSISTHNDLNGFVAKENGVIYANVAIAVDNIQSGFRAEFQGYLRCTSARSYQNGYNYSGVNHGSINAYYSTALSAVYYDYYAANMGYIYCTAYAGSPSFSPALNTVGNNSSLILAQ